MAKNGNKNGQGLQGELRLDGLIVTAIIVVVLGVIMSISAITIFAPSPEDTKGVILAITGAAATVTASLLALLHSRAALHKANEVGAELKAIDTEGTQAHQQATQQATQQGTAATHSHQEPPTQADEVDGPADGA